MLAEQLPITFKSLTKHYQQQITAKVCNGLRDDTSVFWVVIESVANSGACSNVNFSIAGATNVIDQEQHFIPTIVGCRLDRMELLGAHIESMFKPIVEQYLLFTALDSR